MFIHSHNPLSALFNSIPAEIRPAFKIPPAPLPPTKCRGRDCGFDTVWGDYCLLCQDMMAAEPAYDITPLVVPVEYRDAMLFASGEPHLLRIITSVYLATVKKNCVELDGALWMVNERMPFAKHEELVRRVYLGEAR